jgi:hypothetical protein
VPSAKADSGLAIAISRHFRAGLSHSAATRLVPALFQYALFHSARSILSSITGVDLLPTVLTTIRATGFPALPACKLQSVVPWYLLKAY